jgi:hydrogenase nickel incorporation protein HypB
MPETKTIEIKEDIIVDQKDIAGKVNKILSDKKIYAVNVMGGAGSGKTSTIIEIIKTLRERNIHVAVIEGDLESDIDTKTLQKLGVEAYQINTFGNCHLNAVMIETILNKLSMTEKSVLFIENIGNLVCPVEFDIGEHLRILITSITDGSDKPYKYPYAYQKTNAVILNKYDLKDHIDFDSSFYDKGIKAINCVAPLFRLSCRTKDGIKEMTDWFIDKFTIFLNSK